MSALKMLAVSKWDISTSDISGSWLNQILVHIAGCRAIGQHMTKLSAEGSR